MASLPTPFPPDEDRGVTLVIVAWIMSAVSTTFFALRIWARVYKRSLGLDDAFMAGAWLCLVAELVLLQLLAGQGGARHIFYIAPPSQLESVLLLQLVAVAISIPCTGLGKMAIGFTMLRIVGNTSNWQKWFVWVIIALTALTSVIDIFLVTFRCGNPRALWSFEAMATATCLNVKATNGFNTFSAVWQAFTDFVFTLLPLMIVWQLRLAVRKKIYLMVALGLTAVTGVFGSIKAKYLADIAHSSDATWDSFNLYIFFGIEVMLIIVCGSVPALHPLWERFFKKRTAGYESQPSRDHYASDWTAPHRSRWRTNATTIDEQRPDTELERIIAEPSPISGRQFK